MGGEGWRSEGGWVERGGGVTVGGRRSDGGWVERGLDRFSATPHYGVPAEQFWACPCIHRLYTVYGPAKCKQSVSQTQYLQLT